MAKLLHADGDAPDPRLPTPNAAEAERFHTLVREHVGLEYTEEDVRRAATRLLRLIFLADRGRRLKEQAEAKE